MSMCANGESITNTGVDGDNWSVVRECKWFSVKLQFSISISCSYFDSMNIEEIDDRDSVITNELLSNLIFFRIMISFYVPL